MCKKYINRKLIILSVLIALSFLFDSCSFGLHEVFGRDATVETRTSELKILDAADVPAGLDADSFNFVIFTDIHFGHKSFKRREKKFLNWLKSVENNPAENPLFCVSLGDVADHGLPQEYDSYVAFTDSIKSQSGISTYTIPGNHDLYNSGWQTFRQKVYPYVNLYKFESSAFSFYFMDTASGAVGLKQYNYLSNEFKNDAKPKLVFSHFPLTTEGDFYFRLQNLTERNRLLALMAQNNVKHFFSGHTHMNCLTDFISFSDDNFGSISKSGMWVLVHVDQTEKKVTYEVIK